MHTSDLLTIYLTASLLNPFSGGNGYCLPMYLTVTDDGRDKDNKNRVYLACGAWYVPSSLHWRLLRSC